MIIQNLCTCRKTKEQGYITHAQILQDTTIIFQRCFYKTSKTFNRLCEYWQIIHIIMQYITVELLRGHPDKRLKPSGEVTSLCKSKQNVFLA